MSIFEIKIGLTYRIIVKPEGIKLKKQNIKGTNLEVSRIVFGCMNLGNSRSGENSSLEELKRDAVKSINAALEEGINFFDHADIYGKTKSDEVFSAIWDTNKELRDKIILQTKCGIRFAGEPNTGDPGRYDFSYEHIINSVEASLKRLKTDYVDILLLHRPDPLVEPEEVARAFDELNTSGKVRYFGVSNHNGIQIDLLKKHLNQQIVVNQMELNILHSNLFNAGVITNQNFPEKPVRGEGTIEYCRLNEITIQAWSPLALGWLSGNMPSDADDRIRNTELLVRKLAEEKGVSSEAIVIAWLLRHPAKIQPIVGTRNVDRIKASCQADSIELSRIEWNKLFIEGRGAVLP